MGGRNSRSAFLVAAMASARWEYNRILKLLRQRRYRGVVMTPELFDRVQELLASKPRWRSDRKAEYPLSGAVKCAGCLRSFHRHSSTGIKHIRVLELSKRDSLRDKPLFTTAQEYAATDGPCAI